MPAVTQPPGIIIFYLQTLTGYSIMYTMKMTRSHFEAQATLCADIITDLSSNGQLAGHQISSIVSSFCDMCARSNPKFDKHRFATWVSNNLEGIKNNS